MKRVMSRYWPAMLVLILAATLAPGAQSPAEATSRRITAPAIGMNAPIVKVAAKKGKLAIGNDVHAVYTWNRGDPPCDPTGTTVYAGHAWRAGDGVADKWGQLRRGQIIEVAGCRFKVTKVAYWSAKRSIKRLFRVDGAPRIVLIGCKPDDYSKRTMVFARKL